MGKKFKKQKSAVAEKAEQAQEAVSDAASTVVSAAQDTAQQAGDQAKQAAQTVADERGKVGLGFALLLLILGAALYWKTMSER